MILAAHFVYPPKFKVSKHVDNTNHSPRVWRTIMLNYRNAHTDDGPEPIMHRLFTTFDHLSSVKTRKTRSMLLATPLFFTLCALGWEPKLHVSHLKEIIRIAKDGRAVSAEAKQLCPTSLDNIAKLSNLDLLSLLETMRPAILVRSTETFTTMPKPIEVKSAMVAQEFDFNNDSPIAALPPPALPVTTTSPDPQAPRVNVSVYQKNDALLRLCEFIYFNTVKERDHVADLVDKYIHVLSNQRSEESLRDLYDKEIQLNKIMQAADASDIQQVLDKIQDHHALQLQNEHLNECVEALRAEAAKATKEKTKLDIWAQRVASELTHEKDKVARLVKQIRDTSTYGSRKRKK